MDNSAPADEEAALSDFEEDDFEAAPVVLPAAASSERNASHAEILKTALADLENERQARRALENAKADADSAAVRLKAYIHEVIRQRDEALRAKEDRTKQLEEALQLKEDVTRHRDEVALQRDEYLRQKDAARGEIEGVARILVTQAEKVMSMANGIKSFSGSLPRVPKSTGLAAIALGFSKRVEEVVEEILRQREDALKRKDEIGMQMEQRNFSTAIEVSQLEASVTQMEEEVGKKSSELERWQKLAAGKDGRIAEVERAMMDQLSKTDQEAEALKGRVEEVESKLKLVSSETAQNLECAVKAKGHLLEILHRIQRENSSSPSESDLAVSPQDDEPKGFLAVGQEMVDLASRVALLWKDNHDIEERERREFEGAFKLLQEDKKDLELKLSSLESWKNSPGDCELTLMDGTEDTRGEGLSSVSESPTPAEDYKQRDPVNTLIEDGQDDGVQESAEICQVNGEVLLQTQTERTHEKVNDQAVFKIGLLETDLENMQKELERTSSSARLQIDRLQLLLATQEKDLAEKTACILELEKHEESFTGELLAAEEDVTRWKEAAIAEAAAGEAMVEEVEIRNKEIAALNKRLAELRELVEEANSRVGSKEDMAMAAIAARNAAERSLQIADERAADLRLRIEEMSRQLEEFEQRGDYHGYGLLDMCWPWLRGRGRPGSRRPGQEAHGSAEMEELLEPLV